MVIAGVHHTAPDQVLQAVFEAWHMSSAPAPQIHAATSSEPHADEGLVSDGERVDVPTSEDVPT